MLINIVSTGHQWHKAYATERLLLKVVIHSCDQCQLLVARRTDRHDEAPSGCKLVQQLLRYYVRRGGDEDAVLGCILRPAFPAVARPELHVVNVELAQALLGLA